MNAQRRPAQMGINLTWAVIKITFLMLFGCFLCALLGGWWMFPLGVAFVLALRAFSKPRKVASVPRAPVMPPPLPSPEPLPDPYYGSERVDLDD